MKKPEARPQFMPVVIVALAMLALLKANNVRLGFSAADAAQTPEPDFAVAPVPSPAPAAPVSGVEQRLFEQLAQRRAELERREAEVETREQLLAAMEQRVEARLAVLGEREAEAAALEAQRLDRQTQEYAALSNAYERMKARDAAQIFDALEEDILVPVAAGMRTQALSGVLAEMKPDKARRLTILLADRGRKATAEPPPTGPK